MTGTQWNAYLETVAATADWIITLEKDLRRVWKKAGGNYRGPTKNQSAILVTLLKNPSLSQAELAEKSSVDQSSIAGYSGYGVKLTDMGMLTFWDQGVLPSRKNRHGKAYGGGRPSLSYSLTESGKAVAKICLHLQINAVASEFVPKPSWVFYP